MLISEERLQKALTYLAETDEECARAKSLMKGLEKQEKTIKGQCFLSASGTVAEREAKSYTDPVYQGWLEEYREAVYDYEIVNNKRITETEIVNTWRSLNANRRQGSIT